MHWQYCSVPIHKNSYDVKLKSECRKNINTDFSYKKYTSNTDERVRIWKTILVALGCWYMYIFCHLFSKVLCIIPILKNVYAVE